MKFEFSPSKKIREFDISSFIGKTVEIKLKHMNNSKTDQFCGIETKLTEDVEFYDFIMISGWMGKIFGKEGDIIERKIIDVYLIEHMNGGRSDYRKGSSYTDFFDDQRKREVHKFWKGGIIGRMIGRGGGDADQADIVFVFKDFKIEESCWSYTAPEEWYSELHQDKSRFSFPKGFYKNADEAIHFFSDKPNDDMFGERYFPVVVFPIESEAKIRSIIGNAKSHSKAIVTKKHIIFGTRCKPDEYGYVISQTYENGGQVPRAQVWDWD